MRAIDPKFARRGLILVFITLLLDIIGIAIIVPIMPEYLSQLTGDDIARASVDGGILLTVYSAMQFLFAPLIGNLSDRYGRRPILLVSIITFALDNLICAVAWSYSILFIGRILAGISGASFSTCSAYLADLSDDKNRTRNFGLIGIAFGAGFMLGPLIGGLLGEIGPRVPFYVAAALSFINFIFAWFMLPETLHKRLRRRFDIKRANPVGALLQLKQYRAVLWVCLAFFLYWLAIAVWPAAGPFVFKERYQWSELQIGVLYGTFGLGQIIIMGVVLPHVAKRWTDWRISITGLIFAVIGMIGYTLAYQGWLVYVVFACTMLEYLAHAPMRSIAAAQVPQNAQGELQGALTSITSITSMIGPIFYTTIFQHYAGREAVNVFYGAPFVAAFFALVAALMVMGLFVRPPKPHPVMVVVDDLVEPPKDPKDVQTKS